MVSPIAALALTFGLASASALPPQPGKAAPPPPPGPQSPPPPPSGPKVDASPPPGPKGAAPLPPPGPPPAPYHSISSGSVIEVTPTATSKVEASATGNATDVTSVSSALTTESSVPATCADVTSTSTVTNDYPSTIYEFTTTYLPTSTRGTVTIYTSLPNTTASYNAGVWTESNIVHNIGTTTQTYYEEVTTGVCTSTQTIATESTSTVYTGSYTPTPLPTYCPTSVDYDYIYSGDDVTETYTYTSQPLVTLYTTISTLYTEYYYESTTTIDVPVSSFEFATATTTRTIASDCTSTSYTATASTTTTQSAKCAPTNFVTGISGVSNAGGLDSVDLWKKQDPANKDASTCCQVCVEDEECVAMDFYSGCTLYRGSDCGKSIAITYSFPGDTGFLAQAGCGAVAIANN